MVSTIEKTRVAAIYNPQTQTKAELIEGFVVRQTTFQNLFKAIKEAKMEVPEQHYLILGRRGMGKTTLLLRLAYEIENDPALNGWLIPVVFNEEEYGIRRLFNLWERVMDLLEHQHPDFQFAEAERKQLSDQHTDDDAYERALFEHLENELQRSGKKLILFMDNFGDMTRKMSDAEAHRLRKILQTSSNLRIIAASAVVLEAFYKYDHPFYEFFKTVELRGLNKEETRELLLSLSEHYQKDAVARIVEQHPGRVEALRRITSGVIRTIVLLFEIFADDEDGSAFKDLEIVLDRVTPLYKHRMDDLSNQQQAIVQVIALNWDALSVKEIAEKTRLESKIISAQLQNLEKNGIIQKVPTKTKNHLYIVSERFFNVWYLMRNGRRNDEKRVLWLVRFFEEWCDDDMMKTRAAAHRLALSKGGFDTDAAFNYTQAMAQTLKRNLIEQHELLGDTHNYLSENSPYLVKDLMPSELNRYYEALSLWFSGQQDAALKSMFPSNVRSNKSQSTHTFENLEQAISDIGESLGRIFSILTVPELEKAEQCWLWAAELGNADAMKNLGILFSNEKKEAHKSIEWFKNAAEAGNAEAMVVFGWWLFASKQQKQKALEWVSKGLDGGSDMLLYTAACVFAWNNKISESKELAIKFIGNHELLEKVPEDIITYFTLMLAKNEAQWLLDLFTSPEGEAVQLKDRFKPIYYAIFKTLDHPDVLRMGEELEQTVEEILAKAKQMALDYA